MSLQQNQGGVQRPTPVVYDPLPSPGEEFRDAHNGVHSGPVRDRPRRPFHPTKCAHGSNDILSLAASGRGDAAEFVQALLDVVEDNTGVRPVAATLNFIVNTGTPSQHGSWVYAVRMTSPLNASIKMVRAEDGGWQYVIERTGQRTRPRGGADRPLHPRRHTDPTAGQPLPAPQTDYRLNGYPEPPEEFERNVDI